MFLVFSNDDSKSNGKVNKQRRICEKLIGIGSVMENYADAVHHVTVIT